MLFKSQIMTQASGSIGGTTFAHTASGMYQRARSIPVNPNTGKQLNVRNALTALVNRWTTVLTALQRSEWDTWAANTPFVNALGDTFNITGQNAYIGANTQRLQALDAISAALPITLVDDGPMIYNRGDFTTPVPTWSEATGLSLAFTNTDDWAGEDNAVMFVSQGRPQNPARNFFKGPFRLITAILGDSGTPPTSPTTVLAATLATRGFVVAATQRVWTCVTVVRADGRFSTKRIIGPQTVGA